MSNSEIPVPVFELIPKFIKYPVTPKTRRQTDQTVRGKPDLAI